MHNRKKAYTHSLLALLFAPLVACGSKSKPVVATTTKGPSGKVIQAAVTSATVWADDVASGLRFNIDSPEQDSQTTSDASGGFTLQVTPSYKYLVVSQKGTDSLTRLGAATLISPPGAKTVSPLTTLVALDTTGKLAATLNGLLPAGANFDDDFTNGGGLNPASMLFVTAITTAVTSFNTAILDSASRSGATVSAAQLNYITLTLFSQMATRFASLTPDQLKNTANLATAMQAAISGAVTTITASNSGNSNLSGLDPTSIAQTIANGSVATAANIVGNATNITDLKNVTATNVQTVPVTIPTAPNVTESAILTPANILLFVGNVATNGSSIGATITVTSTPTSYNPPAIPVINNPSIVGYNLLITASGNNWTAQTLTINFSDDMVSSSNQSDSSYGHSVLNPANYTFSQSVGCAPASYAAKVVTFNCTGTLQPGSFSVTVKASTATTGVWASSTSLGLILDIVKSFTIPFTTGSTGGGGINLF